MADCILYRILGNNLPPRHCARQSLSDLRFILEYEPELPGLEKRWLINRVVDQELSEQMREEIDAAGFRVDTIPFLPEDYQKIWTDVGELPADHHPWSANGKALDAKMASRVRDYLARDKNRYVMNNNGARNFALRLALEDAAWGMPWDGGCFLSRKAWHLIRSVMAIKGLPYLAVPMSRLDSNDQLRSDPDRVPIANHEPQLCISRHARHSFDPRLRYGSMPKAALLRRLALPGEWHEWKEGTLPWEEVDYSLLDQAGMVIQVGWVFRLNQPSADPLHAQEPHLHGLRFGGINQFIRDTDRNLIAEAIHRREWFFWSSLRLAPVHDHLSSLGVAIRQKASHLLVCPSPCLALKALPEGEPARAHLVVPLRVVPCSDAGVGSEQSDWLLLSSLRPEASGAEDEDLLCWHEFCSSCCTLVLDYHINANQDSLRGAVRLIRCWFMDPQTSMVPSLSFGMFSETRSFREIGKAGITELRDLLPLLDALRVVRQSGELLSIERQCLEEWFCHLLLWLASDTEAVLADVLAVDVQVWLHLLLAAVAAFVGKRNVIAQVLDNLPLLLSRQFTPRGQFCCYEGRQPDRIAQILALHGWVHLVRFSSHLGWDLMSWQDQHGRSMRTVFTTHLSPHRRFRTPDAAEPAMRTWPLLLHGLDNELLQLAGINPSQDIQFTDLFPTMQSGLPLFWPLVAASSRNN